MVIKKEREEKKTIDNCLLYREWVFSFVCLFELVLLLLFFVVGFLFLFFCLLAVICLLLLVFSIIGNL